MLKQTVNEAQNSPIQYSIGEYVRLSKNVPEEAKSEKGVKIVGINKDKGKIEVFFESTGKSKWYSDSLIEEIFYQSEGEVEDESFDKDAQRQEDFDIVSDKLLEYGLSLKDKVNISDALLHKLANQCEIGKEHKAISKLFEGYLVEDDNYWKYFWEFMSKPQTLNQLTVNLAVPPEAVEKCGFLDRTVFNMESTKLYSDESLWSNYSWFVLERFIYPLMELDKRFFPDENAVIQCFHQLAQEECYSKELLKEKVLELAKLPQSFEPSAVETQKEKERQQEENFTPENNPSLGVDTDVQPPSSIEHPINPKLKDDPAIVEAKRNGIVAGDYTAPPPIVQSPKKPHIPSQWTSLISSRNAKLITSLEGGVSSAITQEELLKIHSLPIFVPVLNEKGKGGVTWDSKSALKAPAGLDDLATFPQIEVEYGPAMGFKMTLYWYIISKSQAKNGSPKLEKLFLPISQIILKDGKVSPDGFLSDELFDNVGKALLSLKGEKISYGINTSMTTKGTPEVLYLNAPSDFKGYQKGRDYHGIVYLDYYCEPHISVLIEKYAPKLAEDIPIGAKLWILAQLTWVYQNTPDALEAALNINVEKATEDLQKAGIEILTPFALVSKGLNVPLRLPDVYMELLGLKDVPSSTLNANRSK